MPEVLADVVVSVVDELLMSGRVGPPTFPDELGSIGLITRFALFATFPFLSASVSCISKSTPRGLLL